MYDDGLGDPWTTERPRSSHRRCAVTPVAAMTDHAAIRARLDAYRARPSHNLEPHLTMTEYHFIAAAPSDIAALLAEVDALRSALESVLNYVADDFPNGPDGPCVATLPYRMAYRTALAALAATEPKRERAGFGGSDPSAGTSIPGGLPRGDPKSPPKRRVT